MAWGPTIYINMAVNNTSTKQGEREIYMTKQNFAGTKQLSSASSSLLVIRAPKPVNSTTVHLHKYKKKTCHQQVLASPK